MVSPKADAVYDPTGNLNPREKVAHWTRRAKWCGEDSRRDADGLISAETVNEARQIAEKLRAAMAADRGVIHVQGMTALERLKSLISLYEVQEMVSKKKPVDGDGDGWVYDATPKKRPATPAEMARGARMRAGRSGGPAKKAVARPPAKKAAAAKRPVVPKGAKRAAPKNDYDKRFDKFDRAIKQAVKSGNKRDQKDLRDWIKADGILNAKDRKDLQDMLDARIAGRDDPAPVAGGNREKRGEAGGVPPRKMPAKKAPAKAPAKKPAPKEERTPPKSEQTDRGELKGSDGKPILPPKPKTAPAKKAPAKKPGPVTRAHEKMREAGMDIPQKTGPVTQARREREAARERAQANREARRQGAIREAAARTPEVDLRPRQPSGSGRAETKAYEAIAAAKDDAALDKVVEDAKKAFEGGDINRPRYNGILAEVMRKRRELKSKTSPMVRGGRHQKAIDAAENMEELNRVYRAINNDSALRNVHRRALHEDVDAKRRELEQRGKPRNNTPSSRRGPSGFLTNRPQRRMTGSLTRKARKLEAAKKRIEDAKDLNELQAIKRELNGPAGKSLRRALRGDRPALDSLNNAFREKKQALDAQPPKSKTVEPRMPPNEGRAKAKALMEAWEKKINAIRDEDTFERVADELEADREMPKEQFNAIASALNRKGDDLDAPVKINPAPFDPEANKAFDDHFAGGGKIIDMPDGDAYAYFEANPKRFKIKRQGQINGNASELDIITDQETGERIFVKHERFRMDYAKEHLAALVANQAGLANHRGRIIEGPQGPAFMMQDVAQGNDLKDGKIAYARNFNADQIAKEKVEKGVANHDPQSLVDLVLYDFLIDNRGDRHAANMHFWQKGEVLQPIYLDQGLGFGYFDEKPSDADINISFSRWWASYRGNDWQASRILGEISEGRADLERMIEQTAKKMERIRLDDLRGAYIRGAGGDPNAAKHADAYFALLQRRLEMLKDRQTRMGMVAQIARRGGF